jgi:hypothetical protein
VEEDALRAAVDACRSLIRDRFPDDEHHRAAATLLDDGKIVTGTAPEAIQLGGAGLPRDRALSRRVPARATSNVGSVDGELLAADATRAQDQGPASGLSVQTHRGDDAPASRSTSTRSPRRQRSL